MSVGDDIETRIGVFGRFLRYLDELFFQFIRLLMWITRIVFFGMVFAMSYYWISHYVPMSDEDQWKAENAVKSLTNNPFDPAYTAATRSMNEKEKTK